MLSFLLLLLLLLCWLQTANIELKELGQILYCQFGVVNSNLFQVHLFDRLIYLFCLR